MKKIRYILVGVVLLFATGIFAQENPLTLKINYSAALPMGSFKDNVINKNSFRGFGAELVYHTSNAFSVGIETGSQDFYQKYPRQLYKTADGSDLSAVLSNSVQAVPILLKAQYSFLSDKAVQPFVALGAGGNIITYRQYAGEFSTDSKTKFGWAVRPEAGFFVPFKRGTGTGLSLSAGYNYMPFNYNGIDNLHNLALRAGISFPLGN